jgi:hypothetical protein
VLLSNDSYLQAAEGFLFASRDEIDKLDLRLDDSLKIAEVFALVSIARSLSRLAPPQSGPPSTGADHPERLENRALNITPSHPMH